MYKTIAILTLCLFSLTTQAELYSGNRSDEFSTEFQLSLVPDFALHDRDTTITGFSFGLWNENPQLFSSVGVINGCTGERKGLSIGMVNYTDAYTGLQLGIYNTAGSSITGVQAGIINQAKYIKGVQIGLINRCEANYGAQIGLINLNARTDIKDSGASFMPFLNLSF